MNCLVTGGAGFIGSHLSEALLKEGYQVRVLDDLSTGKTDNLSGCFHKIDWIEGDICDMETVQRACQDVDAIFHHAALASVYQSCQDPVLTHEINVNGTLNLLEAARQNKVKKFIFVSSAAIYDANLTEAKHEKSPLNPLSPYAYSKLMGEMYCEMYAQLYGLSTVCFRYFNVYGARQNPDSPYSGVISIFIKALQKGLSPCVYGDGLQTRDFVHVSDVVQANLLALRNEATGIFNVGTHQSHTILQILEYLKTSADIEFKPARQGDPRHSLADITEITQKLGFHPRTLFSEGLAEVMKTTAEICL